MKIPCRGEPTLSVKPVKDSTFSVYEGHFLIGSPRASEISVPALCSVMSQFNPTRQIPLNFGVFLKAHRITALQMSLPRQAFLTFGASKLKFVLQGYTTQNKRLSPQLHVNLGLILCEGHKLCLKRFALLTHCWTCFTFLFFGV